MVTTPAGKDANALILNVTTRRSVTQDASCILKKGDHPAIVEESVINYGESGRPVIPALPSMIPGPTIKMFPAVSQHVLDLIHEGALKSGHIEPKFLKMVQEELKRP